MAGGSGPAGPNGPADGNGSVSGGLGGGPLHPVAGLGSGAGRTTGEAGRITETVPGIGGVGRTLDSVGGTVGLTPSKTVKDLTRGNVQGVTRDAGKTVGTVKKTVGQTIKQVPKAVKDAPKTVNQVTNPLAKPKASVPKEIKTPAGGSVKTGESGKTGPSVTLPKTQLPAPQIAPVQLPPLPKTPLTSGLGL
jgi:hypothetical protein